MAKDVRIPPQNIDSEKALLGSIMLKPEAMHEIIDTVKPDSFYSEKHRIVYNGMLELFEKNEPIDILSLSTKLKEKKQFEQIGSGAYLTELVNFVPSAANIKHYADIVQKKFMMRNLINAADHVSELGYNEENDIEYTLDAAQSSIFEVTNSPTLQKFIALKDTLAEAWERLERLHQSKDEIRGVKSGFKGLDTLLAGFQKSDLIIIAARPSMGKTALALDIARQAAVNYKIPVGIFSLEMSSQQLVDRMLAAQSSVNAWKLRTGKLTTDEEFDKLQKALSVLSEAPIYIDDKSSSNVLQMRSVARRLKHEKGLELIIVDYLQLIMPTQGKSGDSMVQQVTEISRALKGMARELNIPVIALSQLSRAIEQRRGRPRLSDLRDSGCLLGDTQIVNAKTGTVHTIKELAESKSFEPMPVLSSDKNYRIGVHTMTKVFHSGKKQVYEITTRSGRKITASANHPFLKLKGWTRLDKLAQGERIALPRQVNIKQDTSALTKDELILLAHLIGDGCILPRQPYHYTNAYRENIDAVKAAAHALFDITGRVVKQKNWEHIYLSSPYKLARGKKHPITLWFEKLGLKRVRSYEKCLPKALFECSAPDLALFLRNLWATDGNVSWKYNTGRKPACSVYYATSSVVLARQVQHILLRLGIQSTLREVVAKKHYRNMHNVYIESAGEQLKFLQNVGITDRRAREIPAMIEALNEVKQNTNVDTIPQDAWQLVVAPAKEAVGIGWRGVSERLGVVYNGSALQATGIGRERMMCLAQALDSIPCAQLAESDIFWDTITSIKPLGVHDVYDATVPGVHNFVAQDIIVHNSIEQDADVVMFIHRDDKMNDNSDRPNIAEILVEKHRNGPTGKIELYFDEQKVTFLSIDKSDFGDTSSDSDNNF